MMMHLSGSSLHFLQYTFHIHIQTKLAFCTSSKVTSPTCGCPTSNLQETSPFFLTDTNDIKGLKRTEPWCTAFSQILKKCLEAHTGTNGEDHLEVNSTRDLVSIHSCSLFTSFKLHRFESSWKAPPKISPGKDYRFFPIRTITLKLTQCKK